MKKLLVLLFAVHLSHVIARDFIDTKDLLSTVVFDNVDGGVWKQGWPIEIDLKKQSMTHVYVIPFSHNDPGWKQTFSDYFSSTTRGILTSVVDGLSKDSDRKFVWAELSFFDKWWNSVENEEQNKLKKLLASKQFEFVTGGWVMSDEANPHYYIMITQLLEGHEWLRNHLDYRPTKGWSIDPFGHSSTMGYFNKLIGFDSMVINRIHYRLKKELAKNQWLEFFWQPNWVVPGHTQSSYKPIESEWDMFTHVFPFFSYDIPHTCGPEPAVCSLYDFMKGVTAWGGHVQAISDGNIAAKADALCDQYKKKSMLFRTDKVLTSLGDDFRYTTQGEVETMFGNHQKLHEYMNSHPDLGCEIHFATLSEYMDTINKTTKRENFPILRGDFFTYADKDQEYWSGYYTSRPYHKGLTRWVEAKMRSAEILHSLMKSSDVLSTDQDKSIFDSIQSARRSASLYQHHDGITGTSTTHVMQDYANMLHDAHNDLRDVIASMTSKFLSEQNDPVELRPLEGDPMVGLSTVLNLDNDQRVVVYNSLTHPRSHIVSLLIDRIEVRVLNSQQKELPFQVNPVYPQGITDSYELVFEAAVPAVGFSSFVIKKADSAKNVATVSLQGVTLNLPSAFSKTFISEDPTIKNGKFSIRLSKISGLMQAVQDKIHGKQLAINERFMAYSADLSGAYLFLPHGGATSIVSEGDTRPIIVIKGPLVERIITLFPKMMKHRTLSLYQSEDEAIIDSIEAHHVVDLQQDINKELIVRYEAAIDSGTDFYTDLNGFQMQKRGYRQDRPIQANYYPVTSAIYVQDNNYRLSLHTRQAFGGSSLKGGALEILLDRRNSRDDNRGLGQPVNDNKPFQTTFLLTLEVRSSPAISNVGIDTQSLLSHMVQLHLSNPVEISYGHHKSQSTIKDYSFLDLPQDIHLISMKPRDDFTNPDSLIAHITRLSVDPNYSNEYHELALSRPYYNFKDHRAGVEVSLDNSLKCHSISKCSEWSLTLLHARESEEANPCTSMQLSAYDIRTFVVSLENSALSKCQVSVSQPNIPVETDKTPVKSSKAPSQEVSQGNNNRQSSRKPRISNFNRNPAEQQFTQQIEQFDKFYMTFFSALAAFGGWMVYRKKRYGTVILCIALANLVLHIVFFHFIF